MMFINPYAFSSGVATYPPWTRTGTLPTGVSLSESNLRITRAAASGTGTAVFIHSTTYSSGKRAVRVLVRAATGNDGGSPFGILADAFADYLGSSSKSLAFWPNENAAGERAYRNTSLTELGDLAAFTSDTEAMMEVDFDAGKLWFGAAGTWANSGNPSAGTNPIYTWTPGDAWSFAIDPYYSNTSMKLLDPADFTTPATSGFTAGW